MKQITRGSIRVVYPDGPCFAFNPYIIEVYSGADVQFTISSGGVSFVEQRAVYNGYARIDISKYLQSLFEPHRIVYLTRSVSVDIMNNTDNCSIPLKAIYGVINAAEVFNDNQSGRWFKHFPSLATLYLPEGETTSIRVSKDGGAFESYAYSSGFSSMYSIPLNAFADAQRELIIEVGDEGSNSTFDYTFDNTFFVRQGVVRHRFVVDNSSCGIFLRWVDRHGFVRQYLFKEGPEIYRLESKDVLEREYRDEHIYYGGAKVFQGKIGQRSKKVCATMVEQETFKMLSSIATSSAVELWMNDKFFPVRILHNSLVLDKKKQYQDFETEILLPDFIAQTV